MLLYKYHIIQFITTVTAGLVETLDSFVGLELSDSGIWTWTAGHKEDASTTGSGIWQTNEPNGNGKCGMIYYRSRFIRPALDDVTCSSQRYFICSIV